MKLKIGIVAFAFGRPCSLCSNKIISRIASQKARELSSSVYTQLDIVVESGIPVEYTEEEKDFPPPTLRIARGATQWAKKEKIDRLLIVAAKPHLWRCVRDLEYALREKGLKIDVATCKEIEQYSSEWFCPDSDQEHTRSKWTWFFREVILKFMPFSVYKWRCS